MSMAFLELAGSCESSACHLTGTGHMYMLMPQPEMNTTGLMLSLKAAEKPPLGGSSAGLSLSGPN